MKNSSQVDFRSPESAITSVDSVIGPVSLSARLTSACAWTASDTAASADDATSEMGALLKLCTSSTVTRIVGGSLQRIRLRFDLCNEWQRLRPLGLDRAGDQASNRFAATSIQHVIEVGVIVRSLAAEFRDCQPTVDS